MESLETWSVLYNNGLGLTNYSETEYSPGASVTFSPSLAPDGSSQKSYAQYGRIISTARFDNRTRGAAHLALVAILLMAGQSSE